MNDLRETIIVCIIVPVETITPKLKAMSTELQSHKSTRFELAYLRCSNGSKAYDDQFEAEYIAKKQNFVSVDVMFARMARIPSVENTFYQMLDRKGKSDYTSRKS